MSTCETCSNYVSNLPDNVAIAMTQLPIELYNACVTELCSGCSLCEKELREMDSQAGF